MLHIDEGPMLMWQYGDNCIFVWQEKKKIVNLFLWIIEDYVGI